MSEGTVYVASFDSTVYALHAKTGEKLWEYKTDNSPYVSPVESDDLLYIRSLKKGVYLINKTTGMLTDQYTSSESADSSPVIADGVLYLVFTPTTAHIFGTISLIFRTLLILNTL